MKEGRATNETGDPKLPGGETMDGAERTKQHRRTGPANLALTLGALAFPAYALIPGGGVKVFAPVVFAIAAVLAGVVGLYLTCRHSTSYAGKCRAARG